MSKSIEFCQLLALSGNHKTWNIPRIRDGDQWRIIENAHLVANPSYLNGHDKYEDAIIRAKQIMEKRGWNTEMSDSQVQCHEHLTYHHYRLKCWK